MKKGRFTATVIAMLMLAQPVYAQDVTSTMISTEMQESSESVEETQEEQVENETVIESEDESEFIASGGIIQYDVSQTSEKDSQPVVLTKTPKQDNNETTIVLAPNNQEKAGWQSEDGKSYYYDANGDKCVGEQNIGGKWYYFDTESQAASGWQIINGVRYYFDTKSHVMATGYYVVAGSLYYFDANGACQGIERGYVGWHLDDSGNWYYIRNGHAVTGTTVIDGVMYEFDGYGVWNLKS